MDQERVTIIMPVYNSGRFLQLAIEAIINNTRYPYDLIIVESESTDGSAELCDEYAKTFRHIKVIHTKKEGLVKAINTGIRACDTDVYLTQDDVIVPKLFERDWLWELVQQKKLENCGAVTTLLGGGVSGPTYIDGLHWAGTWSLFIPRSTINQIGLFDENLGPGDDIDYSYRIYTSGLRIYLANFWVDHHRKTEHPAESDENFKEKARLFRQKYKLGEYNEGNSNSN